jgi:hypothetical protein
MFERSFSIIKLHFISSYIISHCFDALLSNLGIFSWWIVICLCCQRSMNSCGIHINNTWINWKYSCNILWIFMYRSILTKSFPNVIFSSILIEACAWIIVHRVLSKRKVINPIWRCTIWWRSYHQTYYTCLDQSELCWMSIKTMKLNCRHVHSTYPFRIRCRIKDVYRFVSLINADWRVNRIIS